MHRWIAWIALLLALGGVAEAGRARVVRPARRVVIDVGGEGRHRGAINLNPGRTTSTTGKPGRPIPRHVRGVGEHMPFPARAADELIVENAPLRPGAARELARVIKPGGRIRLSHPTEYAAKTHKEVIREVGGRFFQVERAGVTTTIIGAPPARAGPRRR